MINNKILKAGGEEFTCSSGVKPIRNIYMALDGADALALMTAHREFREQILIKNIDFTAESNVAPAHPTAAELPGHDCAGAL